jgi:hypothetical protein
MRAARAEAVADARVTTELLAHSVAEPAVPEGLVDGDPGAIDRFDRRVLSRLLVGDARRVLSGIGAVARSESPINPRGPRAAGRAASDCRRRGSVPPGDRGAGSGPAGPGRQADRAAARDLRAHRRGSPFVGVPADRRGRPHPGGPVGRAPRAGLRPLVAGDQVRGLVPNRRNPAQHMWFGTKPHVAGDHPLRRLGVNYPMSSAVSSPGSSSRLGSGGGVPPNSGHSALKEHQSHSRDRLGRQSPDS